MQLSYKYQPKMYLNPNIKLIIIYFVLIKKKEQLILNSRQRVLPINSVLWYAWVYCVTACANVKIKWHIWENVHCIPLCFAEQKYNYLFVTTHFVPDNQSYS